MLKEPYSSLPQLLKSYEQYGALVPNVRLFGSSSLLKRPANTVNVCRSLLPFLSSCWCLSACKCAVHVSNMNRTMLLAVALSVAHLWGCLVEKLAM